MRRLATVMLVCAIASCGTINQSVQKNSKSGWYTVRKSDTLYSIAWRYGLDYRQLAHWNQIGREYIIHPGQQLILVKPGNAALVAQKVKPGKAVKKPESVKQKKITTPVKLDNKPPRWHWPTSGKIMNTFAADKLDRKGIDIAGKLGQSVYAVANGKVVYSGNGLAGYGNLIIIKHNEVYLSAYAYNQQRLVKEGMSVKAGSEISKMGQHPNGAIRLHFEIRKNGKPVDPLKYLRRP